MIKEWQEITQEIKADIRVLDMSLFDTTLHKDLYYNNCQSARVSIWVDQKPSFLRSLNRFIANVKKGKITAKKTMTELGLKTTTLYK